ncbi:TerB family tellurite resistance protein [Consotaella salsifontis]|uniref:Uncharacterized conserved protein, tellurite resistance protein B (TerB) family n=1 Tax=Consotaella salsifontis TaxID=1365950 RepID=A0A1T4QSI5_9HYPH|nr:TerB family tellurite resistance protein [Consotaella salsifontis]SKA06451.1 Uncharacterized conserved protein, tellurite resistance protein B (TerB) family [Consotaella salsifontis]
MLADRLKELVRFLGGDGEGVAGSSLGPDDPRVAAAALLVHVERADGRMTEAERESLRAALATEFSLSEDEIDRVTDAGGQADAEAVDLYRFTNVLMHALDAQGRVRFIELLWEVTFADGEVHELEDNLIWRIADLLGVSTRDRMLMKHRAADRHDKGG